MKAIIAICLFLAACTPTNPFPKKAVIIKCETFPHAAARIFINEKLDVAPGEPRYLNFGDTVTILEMTNDKVAPLYKFKSRKDSGYINIIFADFIF